MNIIRSRMLDALAIASHDILVLCDEKLRIRFANPRFEEHFGMPLKAAVGQHISKIFAFTAEWEDLVLKPLRADALDDKTSMDMAFRRKDGEVFIGQSLFVPVRNEAGSLQALVCSVRNITQDRLRTSGLEQSRNIAHAEQHENEALIGNFIHDVRGSLNSVIGFAELLASKIDDPQMSTQADAIVESGSALLARIERFEEATADAVEQERTAMNDELGATSTASSGKPPPRKRVLIVDDVEPNLDLMRSIFDNDQYSVEVAHSAEETMAAAARRRYDAILLDLNMPRKDGFSLINDLRTSFAWARDIPVIAVSAHTFADVGDICAEAGFQDFVTKPVDPAELRQILKQHLAQTLPN